MSSCLVSSRLVSSCVFSVVVHGVPSEVSFEVAGTEQLYLAEDSGMCSSGPIFKLKMCKIQWLLSVNLSEPRDNPTWANFGERNWRREMNLTFGQGAAQDDQKKSLFSR